MAGGSSSQHRGAAPLHKAALQAHTQTAVGMGQMAQAVQQEHELTAPLSGVAANILADLSGISSVLASLDINAPVQLLRPDHGDPMGLTQVLLAIVNEVSSLRMQADSIVNRIGAL